MSFGVQLTDDAVRDLEDICDYIRRYRSPAASEHVLKQIEQTLSGLSEYPHRGGFPKELLDVGIASIGRSSSSPTASSTE